MTEDGDPRLTKYPLQPFAYFLGPPFFLCVMTEDGDPRLTTHPLQPFFGVIDSFLTYDVRVFRSCVHVTSPTLV